MGLVAVLGALDFLPCIRARMFHLSPCICLWFTSSYFSSWWWWSYITTSPFRPCSNPPTYGITLLLYSDFFCRQFHLLFSCNKVSWFQRPRHGTCGSFCFGRNRSVCFRRRLGGGDQRLIFETTRRCRWGFIVVRRCWCQCYLTVVVVVFLTIIDHDHNSCSGAIWLLGLARRFWYVRSRVTTGFPS